MDFGWARYINVSPSLVKTKHTIQGNYVGNRGGYACVETEGIWEISVSPSQFCSKPKTSIKKIVFKNSKNK